MPDLDYVDLRFGERVYVRPQPQTRSRRASGAAAEQARGRASGAAAEQSGSRAPAGQADSTGKRPRAERRSGG
jgi:hypothetical protein